MGKNPVIMRVCGDRQHRRGAVEIVAETTQNPLVAIPCGFKSHHRHQIPKLLEIRASGFFFDLSMVCKLLNEYEIINPDT